MKVKTDLSEKRPDETKFPHLRESNDGYGYIYIFYSNIASVCLSHSDMAVRTATFTSTEYFTGSITLSND